MNEIGVKGEELLRAHSTGVRLPLASKQVEGNRSQLLLCLKLKKVFRE